jgi:hypothetical protein
LPAVRRPLTLRWTRAARADLAAVAARSRLDAQAVTVAMERMARGGWSLGHPIAGGRRRWWPVPPLGVVYRVTPVELVVKRVIVVRRLRRPIP